MQSLSWQETTAQFWSLQKDRREWFWQSIYTLYKAFICHALDLQENIRLGWK
jgi:hypothetical protein